jgi:CPA2 family monovalent cation:H+ antiporter-2
MDVWYLLSNIVILLAGALLLGGIFSRFGQSPLVGYLLAGMILGGPGSFGAVGSAEHIETISELGVSLLLFSLGLEFSWNRLKQFGSKALLGGALQVVTTALLAAAVGKLFGLSTREAVAVGAMVSLSSTAVVLRILMEQAEIDSAFGHNTLVTLLVQDIAVVPLALLMTLLGSGGTPVEVLTDIGRILSLAALLIVTLYLMVNKIAVYALGTLSLERNRELTIILAVVTGLGSAWASHAAGISSALGAFVAGMFLGSSPFATQVRADISSLRVVLLTLFFGAAGMVADPGWIAMHLHWVLGVTAILIVGKLIVVWAIFQFLGQTATIAAATGLCLAQIGEFAFVLGTIGLSSGILSPDTYRVIVSVAIVSLILTPYLVPKAQTLAARLARLLPTSQSRTPEDEPLPRFSPHVVIIGFGPSGQLAAQPFIGRNTRVLVIELSRQGVRKAFELGFEALIGDATQAELLEHAHLQSAKAIVITIPHYRSAMTILEQVRRLAPHAHLVVRSRYQLHSDYFVSAGAHKVIGDEEEMGEALGRHIQEWLNRVEQSEQYYSMVRPKTFESDD